MNDLTPPLLLIATADGLLVGDLDGRFSHKTLDGVSVTGVIAREGVILAGTTTGVRRSDDLGRSWVDASAGLTDRRITWLAFHPLVSDLELAGTASGAVFVSVDGAVSWRPLEEVGEHPWAEMLKWGSQPGQLIQHVATMMA